MVKRRKWVRGSSVVEMAFLMPVVLLAWILIVCALFYYHDKNILAGAAYETAEAAGELLHDGGEDVESRAEQYFQKRVRGKMLFFGAVSVQVDCGEEQVTVRANADSKGMKLAVEQKAVAVEPEETIRKVRAIKEMGEELAR